MSLFRGRRQWRWTAAVSVTFVSLSHSHHMTSDGNPRRFLFQIALHRYSAFNDRPSDRRCRRYESDAAI